MEIRKGSAADVIMFVTVEGWKYTVS